jgi:hypothetical protein
MEKLLTTSPRTIASTAIVIIRPNQFVEMFPNSVLVAFRLDDAADVTPDAELNRSIARIPTPNTMPISTITRIN